MMDFFKQYQNYPHFMISVFCIVMILGFTGFKKLPLNLFPDADYPGASVVVIWPNALADDIESRVAKKIETALKSIDMARDITTISKDGSCVVNIEFEYGKNASLGASEVSNEINKISSQFPAGVLPAKIFKITSASAPVAVLGVSPKNSSLGLDGIRQICDNDIKEYLLNASLVSDVEVFGGQIPEVQILADPLKMEEYNLSLNEVILALSQNNLNIPGGIIRTDSQEISVSLIGEKTRIDLIKDISVKVTDSGETIYLSEIAKVKMGESFKTYFYHGNFKKAVAINILRAENSNTYEAYKQIKEILPKLQKSYPDFNIEITDTPGEIIELSVSNMINALKSSILLTGIVIFIFLAGTRPTFLTLISIPITFLLTFAGMYFFDIELNIVTLTGIILAVGLLVDDTVVVAENIDRHLREYKKPAVKASVDGLKEVFLADFSGTMTTIAVLIPVMFVGGYTQQILRPLAIVLTMALFSSFIVSVTLIPLLFPYFKKETKIEKLISNTMEKLSSFIVSPCIKFFDFIFKKSVNKKYFFIIPMIFVLVISLRQIPLAGRNLMPPMDTGIVIIDFKTWPGTPIDKTEEKAFEIQEILKKIEGVKRVSVLGGSEPGKISFGSKRTTNEAKITIALVDRFQRDKSIWDIKKDLRKSLGQIQGIKNFEVYEYGATPLSSISAPIDLMITGKDPDILDKYAEIVEKKLKKVKGITDVSRSWNKDKPEIMIIPDFEKLKRLGITPLDLGKYLNASSTGIDASFFNVKNTQGFFLNLRFGQAEQEIINFLKNLSVKTNKGFLPLIELAEFKTEFKRETNTRKNFENSVNIKGFRDLAPISFIQKDLDKIINELSLSHGYEIFQEGEKKAMDQSFGGLKSAILLSIVLVYFFLVISNKSFVLPFVIMLSIPFAMIGAVWAILLSGESLCMPAFMGLILLSGIVVNNSILLLDFISEQRKKGASRFGAVTMSIKKRTRPVLMTAASTIAGMLPVAMKLAVGLERLAPLAVVAVGGLVVSTFLTLFFIPLFYYIADDLLNFFKK
ncbi:MAG: efflux RND transporter permease subunit [Desulforegulaceae bacterium]|nr:efflux RND transporter permease subunit [Desulforegulaceae bacterium]